MLIGEPLPFVKNYIEFIDEAIKIHYPEKGLTHIQKQWLSICIMAILVTNSVCWARFQRAGIGRYSVAALSWMFRKSGIPWDMLLQKITIPVGFSFFMPDPSLTAWYKNDKKLKNKGVPSKLRPPKPRRNPKHPTMPQIALSLLEQFRVNHKDVRIRCIFADALYGNEEFLGEASRIFKSVYHRI